MWKCSICGNENPRMVCRKCGLWECEDILSLRSLTPLTETDAAAYQARVQEWKVPVLPPKKKSPLAAILAGAAVICALVLGIGIGSAGNREPAETLPPDTWKNNVLMENSFESLSIVQTDREVGEAPVFRTPYQRKDIETITFADLNTVSHIPGDHWDVSQDNNGSVLAWVKDGKHLYIGGYGGVCAPEDCSNLFADYINLLSVRFDGHFHTDMSQSFYMMFLATKRIASLDLSSWNTSRVTDMEGIFHGCTDLAELNVSAWDTSSVTNMRTLFFSCSSLISLDLSGWDTSQATDMSWMFTWDKNLAELDLSGWNTSRAEEMEYMFYSCLYAGSFDLGTWETDSVADYDDFMDEGILVNGEPWQNLFKK